MNRFSQSGRLSFFYILILVMQGCSPALNWRDISPDKTKGLALSFPCQPETQERVLKLPGLGEAPVQMRALTCDADGGKWALSYFDAGTPDRWLIAPELWQDALQANLGVLLASQHRVVDAQRLLSPGMVVPGSTPHPSAVMWQARGVRPVSRHANEPVVVNAMYFTKGLRVYQLTWWRRDETTSDDPWQTFVHSAHFLP